MAKYHPEVAVVRATVRPDNLSSRRLLDQYGFREAGDQWDDDDGLETILEVPVKGLTAVETATAGGCG
ncbi:hypothetical protein E5206_06620 [Arthrobacter sp. PAMC25564]|uniref:hypothetical protein n=1 Tax=Arthrobacter sp. PAMC25564 TaxID=2565366 RepID=UPI0010A28FDF|nr:hypothetical protein [Arthrobacter sp. PAMC25564]QCB96643.1 hypothetical protein E5206_06620 [Arthrobacter sp. PAMC25564]